MTNPARRLLDEASFSPEDLNDFLMEQQADEFEESSGELMDWARWEFSDERLPSDDSDELPF